MATALCPDYLFRLVSLPLHCWDPDPRRRDGHQRSSVFARHLPVHRILWDLEVLYIPLPE